MALVAAAGTAGAQIATPPSVGGATVTPPASHGRFASTARITRLAEVGRTSQRLRSENGMSSMVRRIVAS
jgi:hypothetical protein